jgi:hypothetical protein
MEGVLCVHACAALDQAGEAILPPISYDMFSKWATELITSCQSLCLFFGTWW